MSYMNPRLGLEYRPANGEILCGVREPAEVTVTVTGDETTQTFTTNDWLCAYRWLGHDDAAWRLLCRLGCPAPVPPDASLPVGPEGPAAIHEPKTPPV